MDFPCSRRAARPAAVRAFPLENLIVDAPAIIECTIKSMMLVLLLSMPPVLVAAFTGVLVSLLQALTQIQEQTLSFAIKLIAVTITLLFVARWLGAELYKYTITLLDSLPLVVN